MDNPQYFENYLKDDYYSKLLNLSDGTLKAGDGRCFKIHKYVVAKSSKYFYALFCGMGSATEDILIEDMKGETLSNILLYIYTGDMHVTEDNIHDIIVASDYLLLDDLLLRLKRVLRANLTSDNCLQIFTSTLMMCQEEMWQEVLRFIQINFESILFGRDCKICDLTVDILKTLIGDRNMCVTSERSVWLTIVKWVEGDTHSRLNEVPHLLMHLTIADMNENIATEILEHDIVALNEGCKELYEAKTFFNANNLAALQYYVKSRPNPLQTSYNHRQPAKIHFVPFQRIHNGTDSIEMFVTYDEKIDLWRKLFEVKGYLNFMVLLNESLYIFHELPDSNNWRYNAVERQMSAMEDFRTPRDEYVVVELNGLIYILGGQHPTEDGDDAYDVEYFNPLTNIWYSTTPTMEGVYISSAVSFNNSIFAVGSRVIHGLESEMITQVYDPSTQAWSILPSVLTTPRFDFAMVVFHQRICVIGGCGTDNVSRHNVWFKNVNKFDPDTNDWSREADLPYVYYEPKAIVYNDTLIVYESSPQFLEDVELVPSVYWNISKKCWDIFENLSFANNLGRHYISTVEDSELINAISKDNREHATGIWACCQSTVPFFLEGSNSRYNFPGKLLLFTGSYMTITSVVVILKSGTLLRITTYSLSQSLNLALLVESVAGVSALALQYSVSRGLFNSSLLQDLETEYSIDDRVTFALDGIQRKFNCCGVRSPADWLNSQWYHLKRENETTYPDTCCDDVIGCNNDTVNDKGCGYETTASLIHQLFWVYLSAFILVPVHLTCYLLLSYLQTKA